MRLLWLFQQLHTSFGCYFHWPSYDILGWICCYEHHTVYPKKYAHGFVVLCFVVVMQSFIMNSHEVFIHIHQGCFAGTGAIVRLPQCQWSKPDGYGKISQCITTTTHSKAKTVCIFLGIYCIYLVYTLNDILQVCSTGFACNCRVHAVGWSITSCIWGRNSLFIVWCRGLTTFLI